MLKKLKNFSRPVLALLLIVILLPLGMAQQAKQRVVQLSVFRDSPVEIVAVKVKGAEVKPKQKFSGDSDWLNGMTITLKNVSERPIAYVSVLITAYYEKNNARIKVNGQDVQAAIELYYGVQPLPPGDERVLPFYIPPLMPSYTTDLVLTERSRDELYSLLGERNASTDITELTITPYVVFFQGDSDTKWRTGHMLRRDVNSNRERWIRIDLGPTSQTTSKPRFMRAWLAIPIRPLLPPDDAVRVCTYKDLGD